LVCFLAAKRKLLSAGLSCRARPGVVASTGKRASTRPPTFYPIRPARAAGARTRVAPADGHNGLLYHSPPTTARDDRPRPRHGQPGHKAPELSSDKATRLAYDLTWVPSSSPRRTDRHIRLQRVDVAEDVLIPRLPATIRDETLAKSKVVTYGWHSTHSK
jgi:hypothetical protein